MITIGRNFHIIHMTDDLDALDAWYDDVFSVSRWMEKGHSPDLIRDASLVGVGDLCIEPMQPTFTVDGWDKVPIGRFFKRWGAEWHSIAWYVDDSQGLTELRDALENADVELLGLLGGHLEHSPEHEIEDRPIFTHPRGTLTQLEFMVPTPFIHDPRLHVSYRSTWWHDTHPLHIRKQSHVTLATRDFDRAVKVYSEVIPGTLLEEREGELLKTRSAFIAVGRDIVVEIAEPLESGTAIADWVETHHHGMFAVTLQVEDLGAAERYLTSKGIAPGLQDGTTYVSDPATTFGVHWGFTTDEIKGDTRAIW
jgi:catechol 2,3-dioxygenase-like lactoylglutathione lyase family enzyme